MAVDFKNGEWGRSLLAQVGDVMPPSVCDADAPAKMKGWVAALKDVPKEQGFAGALGFWKTENGISIPDWAADVFGLSTKKRRDGTVEILGMTWYVRFVLALLYWFLWLGDQLASVFIPSGCTPAKTLPLVISKGMYDFVSNHIGGKNSSNDRAFDAAWNYLCPNQYPDPFSCVSSYLHGFLNAEDAQQWTQVSGWCPYVFQLHVQNQKWRLGISEICDWYYRGCIVSEPEAMKALRAQGVLEEAEQLQILKCNRPLIGVQEALRWMYVLRDGRAPKELVFTENDCREAIKRHGYTDIEARRFIEGSRALLGVRHILQPYYQGRISEFAMRQALKDNAWRDEDINTLMPFYTYERDKTYAGEIGAPGSKELVAQLAGGLIPEGVFISQMRVLGNTDAVISGSIQEVTAKGQLDIREAGVKGVHADYMSGELNDVGLLEALARFDVRGPSAQNLVNTWRVERSIRSKPASLGELCDWYAKGLLTTNEYAYRLTVLGRSDADARRIIKVCADKETLRQEKLADAAEKQRERDEAKRQAAAAKTAAKAAKATTPKATQPVAKQPRDEKNRFVKIKADIAAAKSVAGPVKTREDGIKSGKINPYPGPNPNEIEGPP